MVMNIPLAIAVYFPSPSTARLKMPPHITLVHRPTNTKAKMLTGTSVQIRLRLAQSTPGTLVVMDAGANMPKRIRMMLIVAAVVIIARLETLPPIAPPIKRPTSIINQ